MSDCANVMLILNTEDEQKALKLLGAPDHRSTMYDGTIALEYEALNYAGYGELEALAKQCEFIGEHGQGYAYPYSLFVAHRKKVSYISCDYLGRVVVEINRRTRRPVAVELKRIQQLLVRYDGVKKRLADKKKKG